ESITLRLETQRNILSCILEANQNRKPVLVGCSGSDTVEVAERMAYFSESFKIDGFLVANPAYNKPSQAGIYQHYAYLAERTKLPIVLYNIPGRTGSNMNPETVLKLANSFSNIVAIKESSGKLEQGMEIYRNAPMGFSVLSGDDPLAVPGIAVGFDGVISVIGNAYPALFSFCIREARNGNFQTARQIHYQLYPMIELIFAEGNPTGIKALMEILGFGSRLTNLPLQPASESLLEKLQLEHRKIQESWQSFS
ncbi:MAG: 4-hydroxy-tetrahydrodipicolinate synthase, partial [Bacteroidia bacterium]|nr:4-hydroxy-tetrahydrodipicolinate synthase [Bacteroidia bacterium]